VNKRILFVGLALIAIFAVLSFFMPSQKIDFNSQVKTDFQQKMHHMHGGVKREANSVCFFAKMPLGIAESGKKAIVPGDADHSELMHRILKQ